MAFLTAGARAGDVVDFILGTLGIPALENSKHGGFQGCSGELAFHAERFKAPSPVEPFLYTSMIPRPDDYIWIAMAAAVTPTTRVATTSNQPSSHRESNTHNLQQPSSHNQQPLKQPTRK